MKQLEGALVRQKINWKGKNEIVAQVSVGSNSREVETYLNEGSKIKIVKYTKLTPTSWERVEGREIPQGKLYDEAMNLIRVYGGENEPKN